MEQDSLPSAEQQIEQLEDWLTSHMGIWLGLAGSPVEVAIQVMQRQYGHQRSVHFSPDTGERRRRTDLT